MYLWAHQKLTSSEMTFNRVARTRLFHPGCCVQSAGWHMLFGECFVPFWKIEWALEKSHSLSPSNRTWNRVIQACSQTQRPGSKSPSHRWRARTPVRLRDPPAAGHVRGMTRARLNYQILSRDLPGSHSTKMESVKGFSQTLELEMLIPRRSPEHALTLCCCFSS